MSNLFYCMKCGAQCTGYESNRFDTMIKYIHMLQNGGTIFLEAEDDMQDSLAESYIENEYVPAHGDAGRLQLVSFPQCPPVFEKVSYHLLWKRPHYNEYTHQQMCRFCIKVEYRLDSRYVGSRESIDRYEIFRYTPHPYVLPRCPVCGEELVKGNQSGEDGAVEYDTRWSLFFGNTISEEKRRFLWNIDETNTLYMHEKDRILRESEGYVNDIKREVELPLAHVFTENIDIRTFLEHFISVEKNIMFLTEHLKALLPIQYKAERLAYREQIMGKKLYEEALEQEKTKMQQELAAVQKKYPIISESISESDLGMFAPKPPILKKSNIFNSKRIEKENAAMTAEYTQKLQKFREDFEIQKTAELERRRRLNEENRLALHQEEERISATFKALEKNPPAKTEGKTSIILNNEMYLAEIAEIKNQLQQLCKVRAQYISSGVVYPKYIDFVALTTMYEYFETGRCTTLAGPDGAYNLYESEIRANRVIDQLDKVIDSLEQIKTNQYKTYCELKGIKENIQGLATKLSVIQVQTEALEKNTAYIAYNTAKTARYAKINAELTNALGFLVALK